MHSDTGLPVGLSRGERLTGMLLHCTAHRRHRILTLLIPAPCSARAAGRVQWGPPPKVRVPPERCVSPQRTWRAAAAAVATELARSLFSTERKPEGNVFSFSF